MKIVSGDFVDCVAYRSGCGSVVPVHEFAVQVAAGDGPEPAGQEGKADLKRVEVVGFFVDGRDGSLDGVPDCIGGAGHPED